VKDAHSLPLETLTELGIVGLALLLVLVGAVLVGARDALRANAALAAGPAAAAATWFVHAAIDWDWEMPALTLIAVACAGLLLSDAAAPPRAG
jgi:O-antigen ligase